MNQTTIILIVLFSTYVTADPKPTGGANCTTVKNCGGSGNGECVLEIGQLFGTCDCDDSRGDPDCSYKRTEKAVAGGLQFLCFAGVGGVGEFVAGNTEWAWLQLTFETFGIFCACFLMCICGACCGGVGSCFGQENAESAGSTGAACGGCLGGIIIFSGFMMTLVRGCLILSGEVTDGNGYDMY